MKFRLLLSCCLLVSSSCLASAPSYAHESQILKCITGVTKVNKLKELNLENGLVAEVYDVTVKDHRASDGKPDIITYSVPFANGHKSFPIFYEIDEDGDGIPDKLYIDKLGDGSCEGIAVYDDYNVAGQAHKSPADMPQWLTES